MRVQRLTESTVSQAFPLVQYRRPDMSHDAWAEFTSAHLGCGEGQGLGDRGILTAVDEQGYIFAMLSYAMVPDLHHGRALIAQDVIAVTPLDGHNKVAIAALFEALEQLARTKHCSVLHTRVNGLEAEKHGDALFASLLDSGHELHHLVLCKALR